MKTTKITGAQYVAIQADLASREGAVSAKLADLFFQCVQQEPRTLEDWDALVVEAMRADVTIAETLEYSE